MDGQAIAARPIGFAGLGALNLGRSGGRVERVRLEAALAVLGESTATRAAGDHATHAARPGETRAMRP